MNAVTVLYAPTVPHSVYSFYSLRYSTDFVIKVGIYSTSSRSQGLLEIGLDWLCRGHEIPPRDYLRGQLQENASVVTACSIVSSCYD